MTLQEVEALIDSTITANSNNAITGPVLKNVLMNILNVDRDLTITCGSGGYTISNSGKTLTGVFFGNTLSKITTNGGSFIANDAFDQDADTQSITLTDGSSFVNGQKLIAKI